MTSIENSIETKLRSLRSHVPSSNLSSNFQPELILRNTYYNEDQLKTDIQRATQKLLPNDDLRRMYNKLNEQGYDSCIQTLQQQQHQQHHCEDLIYTPSINSTTSRNTAATSSFMNSSSIASTSKGGKRTRRTTASTKRVQEGKQKQRRLEVQQREMEKRKAIEKNIRANQLARFALRKTTRKKMIHE